MLCWTNVNGTLRQRGRAHHFNGTATSTWVLFRDYTLTEWPAILTGVGENVTATWVRAYRA